MAALKVRKIVKKAKQEVSLTPDSSMYYKLQLPIINLIEEYCITNAVEGRKMLVREFAEQSGISAPSVVAIMNGTRWVAQCNREIIVKLALTLKVPVMQIFTMSGFLTAKDVIMPLNQEETMDAIYRKMAKDKRMEYRAPTQIVWDSWPESAKLTVCMMYEDLIGQALFRYAAIK